MFGGSIYIALLKQSAVKSFASSASVLQLTVFCLSIPKTTLLPLLSFIAISIAISALHNVLSAYHYCFSFTKHSTNAHAYAVHICDVKIYFYLCPFLSSIGKLRASLPSSVQPPSYDLDAHEGGIKTCHWSLLEIYLFLQLLSSVKYHFLRLLF